MSSLDVSSQECERVVGYLDKAIQLGRNPFPHQGKHLVEGDDAGYRSNPTDPNNFESLVQPAGLECRPVYDGVSPYDGSQDDRMSLPGGVEGGKLLLRETAARACDYAQRVLDCAFGGQYQLIGLDGFRSQGRQRAGWDKLRLDLQAGDLTGEAANSVSHLFHYGLAADDTFAFVNPVTDDSAYRGLEAELRSDSMFMQELEQAIRERISKPEGELNPEEIDEGLFNYIAVSANSGIGRASGRNIRLSAVPMAHNSAVSLDAVLANRRGQLLSSVPFDHPGEISRMDFLERPDAYEVYCAAAKNNPGLRAHLKTIGLNPDDITSAQFADMKRHQRLFYHLTKDIAASMYVGETWHVNLGLNPTRVTGELLLPDSPYVAFANRYGSNTCDARLKLGAQGIAAFGGDTAEFVARRDFGLGQ